jgi:hypothetical protein
MLKKGLKENNLEPDQNILPDGSQHSTKFDGIMRLYELLVSIIESIARLI